MRNPQKCHSVLVLSRKEGENLIFIEKLGSSHNPENKLISLSWNTEKMNFWKMTFLAKNQPKQKREGLQRENSVVTNKY